eukprot:gene11586-11730_t
MPRSASPPRDRKRSHRDDSRERSYKRAREDDTRDDRRHDRPVDYRRDRERTDRRSDYGEVSKSYKEREKERERERERPRESRSRDHQAAGRERDKDRQPHKDREQRDRGRDPGRRRDSSTERRNGTRPDDSIDDEADAGQQQQQQESPAGLANGKPKAEPLSLEELLKKKKEQQALEAKPKFLSKAEREALALQRRQQEAAGVRAQQDELRRLQAVQQDELRRVERARREVEQTRHKEDREKEKELELIRKQYLGGEKEKKKVMRASEKFRFNFDWDGKEDTSKDLNPLYNQLHQANLLYGRGMLAGIDRREQKKQAATVEADMLKKLRNAAGIVETRDMVAQALEKEARADKYDNFDMSSCPSSGFMRDAVTLYFGGRQWFGKALFIGNRLPETGSECRH